LTGHTRLHYLNVTKHLKVSTTDQLTLNEVYGTMTHARANQRDVVYTLRRLCTPRLIGNVCTTEPTEPRRRLLCLLHNKIQF